ncbi:hypothetical protein Q8F55_001952 [Vanrija albida]|uniref:Uncharacterized protein n=1 Tax=Vanrija albida TaxID=181172 RepID=A0ABR3Q939_9TREE
MAAATPIYQQYKRKPDADAHYGPHALAPADTHSLSLRTAVAAPKHHSLDKPLPAVPPPFTQPPPPVARVLEPAAQAHTLSLPILSLSDTPLPSIDSMLDLSKTHTDAHEAQPTTSTNPEPLVPVVETHAHSPAKVIALGDESLVDTAHDDSSPTGPSFVVAAKHTEGSKADGEAPPDHDDKKDKHDTDAEHADDGEHADEEPSRRFSELNPLEIGVTTTTTADGTDATVAEEHTEAPGEGTDDAHLDFKDQDDLEPLHRGLLGPIPRNILRHHKEFAEYEAAATAAAAGTTYVPGVASAQIDAELEVGVSAEVWAVRMERILAARENADQKEPESSVAAKAEAAYIKNAFASIRAAREAGAPAPKFGDLDDFGVDRRNIKVAEAETSDDVESADEPKATETDEPADPQITAATADEQQTEPVTVDAEAPHAATADDEVAEVNPAAPVTPDEFAGLATVRRRVTVADWPSTEAPDNMTIEAEIAEYQESTSVSPASAHVPITPVVPASNLDRDEVAVEVGEADEAVAENGGDASPAPEQDKRSLLEVDLDGKHDAGEASAEGIENGVTATAVALAAAASVAAAVAVPAAAASTGPAAEVAEVEATTTGHNETDAQTTKTEGVTADDAADTTRGPLPIDTEAPTPPTLVAPQNTPAVPIDSGNLVTAPFPVNIADLNKNVLAKAGTPALHRVEEMDNLVQARQVTPPPAYEEQAAAAQATAAAPVDDEDHLTIRPAHATTSPAQSIMSIPSIRSVPSLRSIRSGHSAVAPEEHELFEPRDADEGDNGPASDLLANYGTVAPDHTSPAAVAWAAATRERQQRKLKTLLVVAVPVAALLVYVGMRFRAANESSTSAV